MTLGDVVTFGSAEVRPGRQPRPGTPHTCFAAPAPAVSDRAHVLRRAGSVHVRVRARRARSWRLAGCASPARRGSARCALSGANPEACARFQEEDEEDDDEEEGGAPRGVSVAALRPVKLQTRLFDDVAPQDPKTHTPLEAALPALRGLLRDYPTGIEAKYITPRRGNEVRAWRACPLLRHMLTICPQLRVTGHMIQYLVDNPDLKLLASTSGPYLDVPVDTNGYGFGVDLLYGYMLKKPGSRITHTGAFEHSLPKKLYEALDSAAPELLAGERWITTNTQPYAQRKNPRPRVPARNGGLVRWWRANGKLGAGTSGAFSKGLGASAPKQRIKLARPLPAARLDSDPTLAPRVKASFAATQTAALLASNKADEQAARDRLEAQENLQNN